MGHSPKVGISSAARDQKHSASSWQHQLLVAAFITAIVVILATPVVQTLSSIGSAFAG